jgi:hypothetical protein
MSREDEARLLEARSRQLEMELELDTIPIGPECFAAEDGSVICWRGRNYVPQEEQK